MKNFAFRSVLRNLLFATGLGLVLSLGIGVVGKGVPTVLARDAQCIANSVMYCGFSSPSDFIYQTKNGDGMGHKDFGPVYDHFGLSASEYDRFIKTAKPATFNQDGTVVVAGQVVATNAISYGRWQTYHTGPGMSTVKIGSTTLYGNTTQRVFTGPVRTGYVMFDASGTPEFMVLDACGNPITARVVSSSANCKILNQKPVPGKLNTYDFTADSSASGLAKVTKYVYDFGDGSAKVTKTSGTEVVRHQYAKEGTYTAKVTVYASAPGGAQIVSATASCQKKIVVLLPYYQCVQLGGALLDQKTYTYKFTATIKYGNGATFVSADFDFGDGKTATGIKSTDGKTVSAEHSYAKAGNYSAAAVLRFSVNGATVIAPTCRAAVTPTAPPVPECKPGIPVGDVRCNPCPYDASIPAEDARCEAPVTTLPNTGAGNVIAIGAAALVGGFLWYRHMLFRRHKAAYRAADLGVSPLPLAEPLDSNAPLAHTPVDPAAAQQTQHRSTLRRRRPY